eukprot:TRINITY_DN9433_c0_g1_i1.p1 TRINITY_DN9433_c0_g1~~TRINITY_DN9433_c0_g1_i1.p1  ORF type:complete len:423 (-),score=56.52 TRINITY_DN9433_c0_g1_i1:97-1365(-)
MEASVRLITSSTHHLNRHLNLHPIPKPKTLKSPIKTLKTTRPSPPSISSPSASISNPPPSPNPLGFLLSLSLSLSSSPSSFSSPIRSNCFSSAASDAKDRILDGDRPLNCSDGDDLGFFGEKGPVLTAVLLGWLGAEQKQLKRYADLYGSRGVRTVSFIVPVRDVLGFDLGKRIEARVAAFAEELIEWLSETDKDGVERGLLFHTFSNTGWLAYGAILENLQERGDLVTKIKGCVIDSGADPEINPQVWAAGFSAALLKKRRSFTNSSVETTGDTAINGEKNSINLQDTKSSLIETMLLCILEQFFSNFLQLPDVNRRLTKVINILSNNQPPCPQLYLYSTADQVIPVRSVEYFIQEQKSSGKKIWAYNFGSSPHVDHYRSFPRIYSAELHKFLKECISDCFVHLPHNPKIVPLVSPESKNP